MEIYQELVSNSKVIFWELRFWESSDEIYNQKYWSTRMERTGIWMESTSSQRGEDVNDVAKSEEFWTYDETKMAKYKVKALTANHCSVARKQFELKFVTGSCHIFRMWSSERCLGHSPEAFWRNGKHLSFRRDLLDNSFGRSENIWRWTSCKIHLQAQLTGTKNSHTWKERQGEETSEETI